MNEDLSNFEDVVENEGCWELLSALPYCPSRKDIAREAYSMIDTALPGCETSERFLLNDSDFGKVETFHRVPKTIPSLSREAPILVNYPTIYLRKGMRKSSEWRNKTDVINQFMDLPKELILEVLEFCHPLDLYCFCFVNRAFRTLLISPTADCLWRRSFACSNPSMPPCPADSCGFDWARLFFGPPQCRDCGLLDVEVFPDFALRETLCIDCTSTKITLLEDMLQDAFPHQFELLYPYVLRTFHGDDRTLSDPSVRPDWVVKNDLLDWVRGFTRIAGLKPGDTTIKNLEAVQETLESYQTSRRLCIEEKMTQVMNCRTWYLDMYKVYKHERHRVRALHFACVRNRLLQDGWDMVDIESAGERLRDLTKWHYRPSHGVNQFPRITKNRWKKIQSRFTTVVSNKKTERIFNERTAVALFLVGKFKRTNPPITWSYWPSRKTICGSSGPLFSLISSDLCNPLTEAECEQDLPQVLTYVEVWKDEFKAKLRRSFELGTPVNASPSFNVLSLAAAHFFECDFYGHLLGRYLFGLEEAMIHRAWHDKLDHGNRYEIKFNARARAAVCDLLESLGLDKDSVTAKEMDERGDRLLCVSCYDSEAGNASHPVYRWREAVLHAANVPRHYGVKVTWYRMPTEYSSFLTSADSVYEHELNTSLVWSCNHCSSRGVRFETRKYVVSHVIEVHDVPRPKPDIDFFYHPEYEWRLARRSEIVPDHPLYCCSHCKLRRTLFNKDAVARHLLDVHQKRCAVIGTDYRVIWNGFSLDRSPPSE